MNKFLALLQALCKCVLLWSKPNFRHRVPTMVDIIDQARREWQEAQREFNLVDSELIDYVIFKINTAERRLIALLCQARRHGITAWPPDLPGPITGTPQTPA